MSGFRDKLRAQAEALGFDAAGVADARTPWPNAQWLQEFLEEDRHGDMSWLLGPPASRRPAPVFAGEDAGGPSEACAM